jgi:hypothetical protein
MSDTLLEEKRRYIPYLIYFPGSNLPQMVSTRKELAAILGGISVAILGNGNGMEPDTLDFILKITPPDAKGRRQYTFPVDGKLLPGTRILECKSDEDQWNLYVKETISFCFSEG